MNLFRSRSGAKDPASPASRPGALARASNDSKLQSLLPGDDEEETHEERLAAEREEEARAQREVMELRKQLLRMVLAKTIQKTNVPAAWIGGEINPMVTPDGEEWIEVRLSVQVDEPRFLTYLTSFQADLERR